MKRDTVGKYAFDLLQKEPETRDPIELQREMQKEYIKELYICVDEHKKRFPADFYVVVLTRKMGYASNVVRNYFYGRISCPTPECDQAVFKYHRHSDALEFIWQVPDKDTCELLAANKNLVPESERQLVEFVTAFANGELLRHAKKLNGEQATSPFIEKK